MYVYAFGSCRFLQLLSKQDGAQNKKIKLYFYFISLFITLSDLLHAHRLNARIYMLDEVRGRTTNAISLKRLSRSANAV